MFYLAVNQVFYKFMHNSWIY